MGQPPFLQGPSNTQNKKTQKQVSSERITLDGLVELILTSAGGRGAGRARTKIRGSISTGGYVQNHY